MTPAHLIVVAVALGVGLAVYLALVLRRRAIARAFELQREREAAARWWNERQATILAELYPRRPGETPEAYSARIRSHLWCSFTA